MCCMSHQRQAQCNKQMWKSQTKQQMQLPRIHQDVAQLHLHFSYNFTRLLVTATCLFRLSFFCVCVLPVMHLRHFTALVSLTVQCKMATRPPTSCQTASVNGFHAPGQQFLITIPTSFLGCFPSMLCPDSLKWCIVVCYFCIICNRMKNYILERI